MTKKELYELGFENAITQLQEEGHNITNIDTLKDFAKNQIEEDNLFLAIHILECICEGDFANYFDYDYSMGALENATPINNIEDLEQYCEEE